MFFGFLKGKKKQEETTVKPKQKATLKEDVVRPLGQMDAPMIKARMDKLNVFKGLDDDKIHKLRRLVIKVCRDKTPGLWWEPLRQFVSKTSNLDGASFMITNVSRTQAQQIIEFTMNLSEMIRHSGLIFKNIGNEKGEKLHEGWMKDNTYILNAQFGAETFNIPLTIKEGELLLFDIIKSCNEILSKHKSPYRMLATYPNGKAHCILICDYSEATRADSAKWATMG